MFNWHKLLTGELNVSFKQLTLDCEKDFYRDELMEWDLNLFQDLDSIAKVERKVAKIWLQSQLDESKWEFGVEFDNGGVSSWSSWDMTKTATNFVQTMVNIKTGKTCNQFFNMADRNVWVSVAGLLVPSSWLKVFSFITKTLDTAINIDKHI